MDAGSAALVSAMSGCGPVALLLETERLATMVVAMENTGTMESEMDSEVMAGTGGREFRENTHSEGVVSSRRASARVPSSQLETQRTRPSREKENRKGKGKKYIVSALVNGRYSKVYCAPF